MFLLSALLACVVVHGDGTPAREARALPEVSALHNTGLVDVIWTAAEATEATLTCDAGLLPHVVTEVEDGLLTLRTEPEGALLLPRGDCTLELATPCLDSLRLTGSGDLLARGPLCGLSELALEGSGDVELGAVQSEALTVRGAGSGDVFIASLEADALALTLSGSGELTVHEAALGAVDALVTGSGGAWLAGEAGALALHVSGSGDVDGADLRTGDADLHLSGSGDVHLAVRGAARADLSGSGDLHLYGAPAALDVRRSGSGEVLLR